jgi:hypothetical protein
MKRSRFRPPQHGPSPRSSTFSKRSISGVLDRVRIDRRVVAAELLLLRFLGCDTPLLLASSFSDGVGFSLHADSGDDVVWLAKTVPMDDMPESLRRFSHERPRFRVSWQRMHFAISMPYWIAILVAGTLSAAPQINWSRRFSLRTLLIATTLVAALLGMIDAFE